MQTGKKQIADLIYGYREAKILFTAASLELFTVTTTWTGAPEVAAKLDLHPRNTSIFLNALAGMGFLAKKGQQYRNTKTSQRFLVPGNPDYVGENLKYQESIWSAWSGLKNTLVTGAPPKNLRELIAGPSGFTKDYIAGMQEISRKPAHEIARIVNTRSYSSMLDVGGGSGIYSVSFLKKNKAMKATILDLPETLEITRELIRISPEEKRINLVAGDYHKHPFGKANYDLVLFSHVTHDEGESENIAMMKKAFSVLKSGGQAIIHDFMLDKTLTKPLFSALFSVHMAVYTAKGRVYSVDEYASWLKQAGFYDIRVDDICAKADNPSKIIRGFKK